GYAELNRPPGDGPAIVRTSFGVAAAIAGQGLALALPAPAAIVRWLHSTEFTTSRITRLPPKSVPASIGRVSASTCPSSISRALTNGTSLAWFVVGSTVPTLWLCAP